jgi:hypothetical protein
MKVSDVPKTPSITMKTTSKKESSAQIIPWWTSKSKEERGEQLIMTASFLKESQNYRHRQASVFAKLYGNQSMFSFVGTASAKIDGSTGLPSDRPTFNLIQSAADTLVSRISQNRPTPVFLTDNGDYKERNLAKRLNNFILGEFYQTKAYEKAAAVLRDACVVGTGCLKVFATPDNKVGIDRVLPTELFVDPNEAIYGEPRQLYQIKLVDRKVLEASFPDYKSKIAKADQAYVDDSANSSKTVSDLVMVVEGWRLPSGKDAGDGRHTMATSAGVIFDEEWSKDKFPFVFLHYSPRLLGFWAQGLSEQLMGTQLEINSLLYTISKAIKLVGVPRVFVESGSKVVRSHLNNDIGSIVEYQGTKPQYEVAPAVPQEMYAQLQRLIEYGYQQCGVSALDASSKKPSGLNSGEAIRAYDDISTDRFATLAKRYDTLFVDLAYQVIDVAKDICIETGSYQTVYPGKDGIKKIDLPNASLLEDPFVIQAYNMSSLPKDPAGRLAKVTEMAQAGMITLREARRLLDFPDLSQMEKLANAAEERIFQQLDEIIEDGTYSPPDPFTDLELAKEISVQYINLYGRAKLENEKCQLLRNYYTQVLALMQAAQPPAPAPMPGAPGAAPGAPSPQAVPAPAPVSPLLPNAPGAV